MEDIGVVDKTGIIKEERRFSEQFIASKDDIIVPEELRRAGIEIIDSIGDLSRNISLYNERIQRV